MRRQHAPANPSAPRWLVLVLALAATAIAACNPDATAEDAAARQAIKGEIAKGVHALKYKNVDEYIEQIPDEALPPDTLSAVSRRDLIRSQLIATWAKIEATRVLKITIDSVHAHGDSATVVTTMKWDRLIRNGMRQIDTLVTTVKHREVWKRTPKGWRSMKLLSSTGGTTRNGVPTDR